MYEKGDHSNMAQIRIVCKNYYVYVILNNNWLVDSTSKVNINFIYKKNLQIIGYICIICLKSTICQGLQNKILRGKKHRD